MRATLRLLAAVRPGAARYLEPGTPTGLTGLVTHASPRSTLLYLYSTTLDRLAAGVPEHSVYRQSVEAVTRHRLDLVEAAVPAGHAEWTVRAQKRIADHPDEFNIANQASVSGSRAIKVERDGRSFVVHTDPTEVDMRDLEWDGELDEGAELEGSRSLEEKQDLVHIFERTDVGQVEKAEWEPEPQLTAEECVPPPVFG